LIIMPESVGSFFETGFEKQSGYQNYNAREI
jgi:hypothetical protein